MILRGAIQDFGEKPLTLPELRARFEQAALETDVARFFGLRVHVVELAQREASFTLPLDAPPTGVELDPRHRLLIWTEDYGAKPTE